MFTWICPQCGGEVLPSQQDCPRCVKLAQPQPIAQPAPVAQAPVAAPVPVAPVAPAPAPVPMAAPAPQQYAPPAHYYQPPPPEPPNTGLRDVLVTLGVAAVLLGAGYFVWNRDNSDSPRSAESKTELESVKGGKSANPLAKQIEVTGIRLRIPKQGQAEIQLLVVNHSAAEIAQLSMDVVLIGKGTTKTVAAFPLKVKRLGPFGSVEVTAKAKPEISAIDIPDWQFLEARVAIQATEP